MWKLVYWLGLLSLCQAQTTNVLECVRHAAPLPINAYVEGCIEPPCSLPQLEDAVIQMVFKAPYFIQEMTTVVTAYLSVGAVTLPVPYDLRENSRTCNFLTNSYCPVLADEVLQYTLRMHVDSTFPVDTRAILEFRIQDDSRNPFVCIRIAIHVQEPRESRVPKNLQIEN